MMSTPELLATLLADTIVVGVAWGHVLVLANRVRRGDYGEDELDEYVEVSGF
jgi:hypothetical protein